jgi:hypothetical protein
MPFLALQPCDGQVYSLARGLPSKSLLPCRFVATAMHYRRDHHYGADNDDGESYQQ